MQKAAFDWARFAQGADFDWTEFAQGADFLRTVFAEDKSQENHGFSAVANFRFAEFHRPELIRFIQVNREGRHGLCAQFAGCNIEQVQFEDVYWNRERGRIVLQDEIAVRTSPKGAITYARVASTYCQLINNFERARTYDLAEDCAIGSMEMKRLDPAQPVFSRTVVYLYRLASNYGSSYQRALGVLAVILVAFGLLYSLAGLTRVSDKSLMAPGGFVHSLEVATFQSNTRYVATNGLAWSLEILERILVPAQLSLLLLSLRRRFRR